jgi:diadenylate cyclase
MFNEYFTIPRVTWIAVLDILIVAFIIYQVLVLMKGTTAVQMALGLTLLVIFFYFSRWSRLETVSWLLTNILPYFVFAIIVIFQSEIRRALAHFGKTAFFKGFTGINRGEFYDEIVLAATTLASKHTGALIVIERDIGLKSYIESGIPIDAALSYDLLVTVFNPSVPLHDGAVIIQNNRIAAAACFLPLTVKPRLSKELGTRHRAAIGVTEETDAVAIVVSEETGGISFAHDGEIERSLDGDTLKTRLRDVFERRTAGRSPGVVPSPVENRIDG